MRAVATGRQAANQAATSVLDHCHRPGAAGLREAEPSVESAEPFASRNSLVTGWISVGMALFLAAARLANNRSRVRLPAMPRLPLTPFPLVQSRAGDAEISNLLAHKTVRRTNTLSARAWQRMLSGRRLDLLDPSALDIEIEDIAHGLARVARWNGQTKGAHIFSVAQHSLLVEAVARARVPRLDRRLRLAVLLHDAPEYVIGDMISPFKAVIGDAYKAVERRLLTAIHLRFGLPAQSTPQLERLIKTADRAAAYLEATRLAGFDAAEARRFFGRAPAISPAIERDYLKPWPAETAQARYLERFKKLAGE
jgi:5'-deoxynucleotidase YfbR-like HD superfamily hydrolase